MTRTILEPNIVADFLELAKLALVRPRPPLSMANDDSFIIRTERDKSMPIPPGTCPVAAIVSVDLIFPEIEAEETRRCLKSARSVKSGSMIGSMAKRKVSHDCCRVVSSLKWKNLRCRIIQQGINYGGRPQSAGP